MPLRSGTANADHPLHNTYCNGYSAFSAARLEAALRSLLLHHHAVIMGLVLFYILIAGGQGVLAYSETNPPYRETTSNQTGTTVQ
jgi:hypothetical protein